MPRARATLRIIGGTWRSRLVTFAEGPGMRPTPDRVRQTLFDWLAPLIEGARCLDAFAGSGALGLEALSRGAAHVTFVERGAPQVAALRAAVATLGAGPRAQVLHGDALAALAAPAGAPFDVVFLDPPYASDLLAPALAALPPLLAPVHRVYLEWPASQAAPAAAPWRLLREKQAGQVSYGLAVRDAAPAEPTMPRGTPG